MRNHRAPHQSTIQNPKEGNSHHISGVLEHSSVFLGTSRTRPLPLRAWYPSAAREAKQSRSRGMAPQVWMVGDNGEDLQGTREFLPLSKLEEIGVLYWHLDPKKSESEEKLAEIRKERGYSYMDLIEICPGKLENYEEKVRNFFREHMHADEEIRYCLEGSGYFDVRDKDDRWVRIWIKEGDMIVLPAGIYHRFTVDNANYVKLMRLFIGEPVWTAYNRPQEGHPVRQEYVKSLTGNSGFALAAH